MPVLTRSEICQMLPHGEDMCLLDEVQWWDESDIVCTTNSHLNKDHPLRHRDLLESICGIEYAAQAMGIHIALTAFKHKQTSLLGLLGGLRDVTMNVSRLDLCPKLLNIQATCVMNTGANFMYTFHITTEETSVLSGRASIFVQRPQDQV
ncbi:MAG: hypothetical protein NPIRA04_16880 [Nitrospirales bacterium]|nr:MAG: hypothetical protein NPIRA04_16880 [Nitrospirales bacterium]